MRASGYQQDLNLPVQISMVQTEKARTLCTPPKWPIHHADIVLIDEVHGIKSATAQALIDLHIAEGASIVGLTATPLNVWHILEKLVVAGKNSELRGCGAHLWCREYCPTMPDMLRVKRNSKGEYSERDADKQMSVPTIFGHVIKHYARLNPHGKPTLLFGPSVASAKYFCDAFNSVGVKAAHIDGKEIYYGTVGGTQQTLDSRNISNREELFDKVRRGEIQVLTNRYVMVEGIDLPQVGHLIFATPFGSVTQFLQAGGRLLRNHDTLKDVCLQDHGGSFWAHGSLNEDREWEIGKGAKQVRDERIKKVQDGEAEEGIICGKCGAMRLSGPKCFECGHKHVRSVLNVQQTDGSLKQVRGPYIKRKHRPADAIKAWNSMYFPSSMSKSNRPSTFHQLAARFKRQHPEYHLHKNKDANGQDRLAVVDSGKIIMLPNCPAPSDVFLMSQAVRDVDKSDLLR
jgi:hypothetical protein